MSSDTTPIRIVVADRPPLLSIDRAADGTPIYSGFLWELLPTLLQQARINSTYTVYEKNIGSGGKQANGSWTGIMGQLTTDKADLALFPLTMTAERAAAVSYTIPFMSDGYGLVVQQQQVSAGYSSFLMPFDTMLWVMLLVALVVFSLLMFGLDYASRRARLTAIAKAHGSLKLQRQRTRDRLMDQAMANTMMAFGNGEAPKTHSISIKVWTVAWAFFCVIMLNSYTATLTANLTTSQLTGSIASVLDLAQSGKLFGVPADSSASHYFQKSYDELARKLRPRMIEFASYTAGAQAVRNGAIAAFVCDFPDAVYITQLPPCDLTLGSESIHSGQLVLGLAPNSSLTTHLNMALLQLSEAGYLAVLRRRWFVEANQCQGDNMTTRDGRLRLPEIWTVFLIPVAGAVLAGLVLLGEILYYRKFYKGVVQLKQDMATVGPMRAFSKRIDSSRILTAPQHSGSLRSVPTFGGSLRSVPTFDSLASQTIPEYDVELAGSSPKSPVYSNGSYSYRGQGSSGLYNLAVIERDQQAELTSARQSAVTSANDSSSGSAFYPSIPRMPSARDADDGDVHVGDGQPPSDMTVRVHSP